MKLTGLFVLAFLACCLSFPVGENLEKDEELQKKLEELILADEGIPERAGPPRTEGDEEIPEGTEPPGTEGDEEIPEGAEPPDTEGDEEIPEGADPPGTEGDEEIPERANPPATEGDEEIPEGAAELSDTEGEEDMPKIDSDYPAEIPEDKMNLEELLSEDEEIPEGEWDNPSATDEDEDN